MSAAAGDKTESSPSQAPEDWILAENDNISDIIPDETDHDRIIGIDANTQIINCLIDILGLLQYNRSRVKEYLSLEGVCISCRRGWQRKGELFWHMCYTCNKYNNGGLYCDHCGRLQHFQR